MRFGRVDLRVRGLSRTFPGFSVGLGQIIFEHVHGAATRIAPDETAFPHRAAGYNLLIISEWMNPADNERCTAWARDTYSAMKPFMAPGRYVNYLGDQEPGDPVAAAYGPNYARLRELKKKYDPENFFHRNQNIRPARDRGSEGEQAREEPHAEAPVHVRPCVGEHSRKRR